VSGSRNAFDRPGSLVPDDNPLTAGAPTWADAYSQSTSVLGQWLAEQRAKSSQMGLWNDQTGLPTGAGVLDAGQQYANALMMGTTAPEGRFSLEHIHPRTLRPMPDEPNVEQPGSHAYSIKDPAGEPVGIVDTVWDPETGGLHIADIQSNDGKNSLGLGAIRQIRDLLVDRYPGVKTLSGQRITGAVSADRRSGAGPGRQATQDVRQQDTQ
jgi:hypothetical protein